jgi:iron complex outermembrane receptor protein
MTSIKYSFVCSLVFLFILQTQTVQRTSASEESHFGKAQELVDGLVAKHPGLVRLTIHAVPTGKEGSRIIACNIQEKIGKPSDPEDLEVMKANQIVVLKEGDNLDVTAPIRDKAGNAIAATGITLRFGQGETEDQVVQRAKAIAEELTTAIHNADKPFW